MDSISVRLHKWLLVASAFCLAATLTGCDEASHRVPTQLEAERWTLAWLGALNSRSREQVDGLFPENTIYWSAVLAKPIPTASVAGHVQHYWRLFPHGQVERRAVHRGPGRIVIEWQAWPEASLPGKRWSGVTVFSFGRRGLREVKTFFDPTVLLPYLYGPKH